MNDQIDRYQELNSKLDAASSSLKLDEQRDELKTLSVQSEVANFWDEPQKAQVIMKRIGELESRLKPWDEIKQGLHDTKELLDTNDSSLLIELEAQLSDLDKQLDRLKDQLKLSGPYDSHNAIVSIYAGAGGTDAQDWAQILLRMYVRFAEKSNYKVKMIDESAGDEAGLKSVTFEVWGNFAFGRLKGEHGVHRLVRLSPFNADNLRQTSFAKVEVIPVISSPQEIQIDDKDLKIDVYRSGGHGGQSVNTTDSAVRITHLPTNIVVAIQNERSQLQNKETAMIILRSKLAQLQVEQHAQSIRDLKGPNEQAAWGNQIRSYVLHPYKQVKDLRTRYETSDVDNVLNGDLGALIEAYLEYNIEPHNLALYVL